MYEGWLSMAFLCVDIHIHSRPLVTRPRPALLFLYNKVGTVDEVVAVRRARRLRVSALSVRRLRVRRLRISTLRVSTLTVSKVNRVEKVIRPGT